MEQRNVFQFTSKSPGQSDKGRLFFNVREDPEDLGGFALSAVVNAEEFENGELSCQYALERLKELSESISQKAASAEFEALKKEITDFLSALDRELFYISGVKKKEYTVNAGICLVISNSLIAAIAGNLQCCVLSGGILRFLTPEKPEEKPLGCGDCIPKVYDAVLPLPASVLLCDDRSVRIPAADIASALLQPSDRELSRIALEASRSGADGKRLLVCTRLENGERR